MSLLPKRMLSLKMKKLQINQSISLYGIDVTYLYLNLIQIFLLFTKIYANY